MPPNEGTCNVCCLILSVLTLRLLLSFAGDKHLYHADPVQLQSIYIYIYILILELEAPEVVMTGFDSLAYSPPSQIYSKIRALLNPSKTFHCSVTKDIGSHLRCQRNDLLTYKIIAYI